MGGRTAPVRQRLARALPGRGSARLGVCVRVLRDSKSRCAAWLLAGSDGPAVPQSACLRSFPTFLSTPPPTATTRIRPPEPIVMSAVAGKIAPITGMLRKSFLRDLTIGLGLGFAGGSIFWYGVHLPYVQKRDAFYAKLQAENDN